MPDLKIRTANNLNWAKLVRKHRMVGQVATGWSRYNTFMVPCESIEVSLDSLVIAAAAMRQGVLPKDHADQAKQFLARYKGGREGKRFSRCHAAAKALSDWSKGHPIEMLKSGGKLAFLNGEPERRNPAWSKIHSERTKKALGEGDKLGQAFIAAHRGLVPERWLKLYVRSRLDPYKRLFKHLREDIKTASLTTEAQRALRKH